MSALPKKLIGHDMLPYLTSKDKRRARTLIFFRRLVGATLITAAFAIVSHMANAGIDKRTLIAKAAAAEKIEHAADCYGAQAYMNGADKPEYLVSPQMAAFITLYGHGAELTECDMQ